LFKNICNECTAAVGEIHEDHCEIAYCVTHGHFLAEPTRGQVIIIWFGDEAEPESPEDLCEDYPSGVYPKPSEVLGW